MNIWKTWPMNHLESPPNLSLSLRKFWSCKQLGRSKYFWIYWKQLKLIWMLQWILKTRQWKCVLLNISDQTQPWKPAVRMVLAFLESHTWKPFISGLIGCQCNSFGLASDLTFLPYSPWCRISWISDCLGRTPFHNAMLQSQLMQICTGAQSLFYRQPWQLTHSTHRLHDGKYDGWSRSVQAEETEDLDDQGVRISDQVHQVVPQNGSFENVDQSR